MLNNQEISTSNLKEKSAAAGKTTELIPIVIDGQPLEVPYGTTILEAANKLHIFIPTLCSHSDLPHSGTCRMCVVEVEGMPELQASCEYEIKHPSPFIHDLIKFCAHALIWSICCSLITVVSGIISTAYAVEPANCRQWQSSAPLPCISADQNITLKKTAPAMQSNENRISAFCACAVCAPVKRSRE